LAFPVADLIGRQHLDGDQTVEAGIPCFPDDPHASLTDFLDDLVMGERLK
jgi:hypothetical protein